MALSRRKFLAATATVLGAPAVLRIGRAQAAQVTLRLHHFLPALSNPHSKLLVPWCKKVEAASAGALKIDVFPSMQLGGTAPQLYDQAKDGVVDMVWTLPGYTSGRFPTIEVFELPFVAARRAIATSRALQEFSAAHLGNEFREVRPLFFWTHDHGLIHSNKPVAKLEDLKGMKLRFPTRLAGEALKALGASAIGMPVPQVPESLAQNVIDGCVVPWEVVPSIKVHELVKNHLEIPGSPTLYTATFVLAMNKAKYETLSADQKKAIDDNAGAAGAEMAGKVWDEASNSVFEMVKKRGNNIVTLDPAEKERWRKATEPVTETWLKTVKDKGVDGGKVLEIARALIAKHDQA